MIIKLRDNPTQAPPSQKAEEPDEQVALARDAISFLVFSVWNWRWVSPTVVAPIAGIVLSPFWRFGPQAGFVVTVGWGLWLAFLFGFAPLRPAVVAWWYQSVRRHQTRTARRDWKTKCVEAGLVDKGEKRIPELVDVDKSHPNGDNGLKWMSWEFTPLAKTGQVDYGRDATNLANAYGYSTADFEFLGDGSTAMVVTGYKSQYLPPARTHAQLVRRWEQACTHAQMIDLKSGESPELIDVQHLNDGGVEWTVRMLSSHKRTDDPDNARKIAEEHGMNSWFFRHRTASGYRLLIVSGFPDETIPPPTCEQDYVDRWEQDCFDTNQWDSKTGTFPQLVSVTVGEPTGDGDATAHTSVGWEFKPAPIQTKEEFITVMGERFMVNHRMDEVDSQAGLEGSNARIVITSVRLPKIATPPPLPAGGDPYRIPIGVTMAGELVWDVTMSPHALFTGRTRSGKGEAADRVLGWCISQGGWRLFHINPKGTGELFAYYQEHMSACTDLQSSCAALEYGERERARRERVMFASPYKNFNEYTAAFASGVPGLEDLGPRFLFDIDELAALMEMPTTKVEKEFALRVRSALLHLLSMGASGGVHVMANTQHAVARAFGGDAGFARANYTFRLMLAAQETQSYFNMLDGASVSQITNVLGAGPGRALAQGANVSSETTKPQVTQVYFDPDYWADVSARAAELPDGARVQKMVLWQLLATLTDEPPKMNEGLRELILELEDGWSADLAPMAASHESSDGSGGDAEVFDLVAQLNTMPTSGTGGG